jgi:hypothetical protein
MVQRFITILFLNANRVIAKFLLGQRRSSIIYEERNRFFIARFDWYLILIFLN